MCILIRISKKTSEFNKSSRKTSTPEIAETNSLRVLYTITESKATEYSIKKTVCFE